MTGDRGWAQKLLYDSEGTCIGVLCKDGTVHLADAVVLCTGANTAALIDAKDEIVARSHCIGVIQLSPAEIQHYRALPIVDDFEQGMCHLTSICRTRLINVLHLRYLFPSQRQWGDQTMQLSINHKLRQLCCPGCVAWPFASRLPRRWRTSTDRERDARVCARHYT